MGFEQELASQNEDTNHPDSGDLRLWRCALTWWEAQRSTTRTSSVRGSGAISLLEESFSSMLGGRRAVALANATMGLRCALQAAGVSARDEVLVNGADWPAARAAVRSLGAVPKAMPIDVSTLNTDVTRVASYRTSRTRAVVVTHLHGVATDVAELRRNIGADLPIIEDAAQALGTTLGANQVGTMGDYAVFSMGPGKVASAGELGIVVCATPELTRRVIALSQHPLRQLLSGIRGPDASNLASRVSGFTAIVGAFQLAQWRNSVPELHRWASDLRNLLEFHGATLVGASAQPGSVVALAPMNSSYFREDVARDHRNAGRGELIWSSSGAALDSLLEPSDVALYSSTLLRLRIVRAPSNSTPSDGYSLHLASGRKPLI